MNVAHGCHIFYMQMRDLLKKDAYYSHIVMTLQIVSSPFFVLDEGTVTGCWKSASNILALIFSRRVIESRTLTLGCHTSATGVRVVTPRSCTSSTPPEQCILVFQRNSTVVCRIASKKLCSSSYILHEHLQVQCSCAIIKYTLRGVR